MCVGEEEEEEAEELVVDLGLGGGGFFRFLEILLGTNQCNFFFNFTC